MKSLGPFIYVKSVPSYKLYKYFSLCDIDIWPSEATISVLEAMSCSLPIICHKSTKERVRNNNGYAIHPNVIQITNCINKLTNSEMRLKMGRNSRKYIENELSWNKIAKIFLE